MTDLIEAAGGVNPFGEEAVKSRPVSDAEVVAKDPDAIVISWCGVRPEKYRPDVVRGRAAWRATKALRQDRVHCVPEAYLGRPGPRLVEGFRALREIVLAASAALALLLSPFASPCSAQDAAPLAQEPVKAPPSPPSVPSAPTEEFAGCWQDVADADRFLELEPGRMRELDGEEMTLTRSIYDVDTVTRFVWGRREVWRLSFEGEDLQVETGAATHRFRRAPARPAALDPKPLELGAAAPLDEARLAAFTAEMRRREERDQAVRTGAVDVAEMKAVDAANTAWLIEQVRELGWIDQGRFGAENARGAFLIVQHSGHLPLMLAALPPIERDVKEHGLDPQNYALLFDRLRIRMGERQRYGSQVGQNESGRRLILALEDRERVEQLRKEIGLFPLKRYLEIMRDGGGEIVFEDDLPE